MTSFLWKKTVGVLACLALLCGMLVVIPAASTAEAQEAKLFTILHTNDEHSEIIPYGPASDYPTYPTRGGFSRIASEVGRIKAEKTAAGEPVLTLSAGDYNQGTLFGWLETQAAAELAIMQMIGYDAIAVGNHDFDMGAGYRFQAWNFAKTLPAPMGGPINIPILCANIMFDDANPEAAALKTLYSAADLGGATLAIQPYTVKTLSNGLKVGIFGLLGVEAEAVAPNAGLTGVTFGNVNDGEGNLDETASFLSRAIKAQTMVNTLKGAGCDVVVALSHCGTSEEVQLAQFVAGLDVIVGGHSHDLNYPPIIAGAGDTIIVQAGAYSAYLGELELEYAGGKVSVRNATAIPMDDSIPTVPAIDAVIANYVANLNAFVGMDIMATMAETDLMGDGGFNINDLPPLVETNLGDLVTDAYKAIATGVTPAEPVDLGFEANGVIRAGIPKGGLGHFCFYDLYRTVPLGATPDAGQIMPFGYPMVSFYLFGAEILGVLEATLDMGRNDFFVQLSGAQYDYRPAAPAGSKVTGFLLDDGAGNLTPINPAALYKVATNYYTASFLAAFGVAPRTNAGAPTTVYNSRVLAGPNEIKCWQAILQYVLGMPDLDGDGLPNIMQEYAYPQQRIEAAGWYMAEGSTMGGMETYVLVQNPGDEDVHVNVKFLTDTGEVAPADLQGVTIPAGSRRTYKANEWVDTYDASAVVEPIDGDIVCERAMYGGGRTWAHDSIGATAPEPAQEWFLAEGSTGGGMETYVLVQNPYKSDVHVDIAFQTDTGEVAPADLQGVAIPAESRATFDVGSWVPGNYNVSTFVEAQDGRVVCERAMYGGGRTWAHDSIGTSVLSADWYLAEGSTDGGMETFVLVQNPTGDDVHINLTFNTDAGDIAPLDLRGVLVPANSRRTFKVNDWVTNYNVSTYVECIDGIVVAERAMYGGGRTWAHDSIGATSPANVCFLAEGSTDGGMETFVLVQNPGATDAKVDIVFQTGAGEIAPPALQGVSIPAYSRRTFKVNDWVTTYDVSTLVVAEEGQVIVERAMYGNSRTWAHDSIGYMMTVILEPPD